MFFSTSTINFQSELSKKKKKLKEIMTAVILFRKKVAKNLPYQGKKGPDCFHHWHSMKVAHLELLLGKLGP